MRWLSLLLLVVLAWCVWALATLPPEAAALRVPAPAPGDPPVVRGAYHVHSRASDGTGTIEDIAAAAGRAGLRFVVLTDHGDAYRRSVRRAMSAACSASTPWRSARSAATTPPSA